MSEEDLGQLLDAMFPVGDESTSSMDESGSLAVNFEQWRNNRLR